MYVIKNVKHGIPIRMIILNPVNRDRLKTLSYICIFTVIVGIIYQAITEDGYVGPAAFTMGLFLGLFGCKGCQGFG